MIRCTVQVIFILAKIRIKGLIMGTINTYTAYHATDKSNVNGIMTNNFTYNVHDDHWLGNGVYFFLDKNLAIKWPELSCKKYGVIKCATIFEVEILTNEESVCDLRDLKSYNFVKDTFVEYWNMVKSSNKFMQSINMSKIRCAFFDWLIKEADLKCIIAYFTERNNLTGYIDKSAFKIFSDFHIPYIEVQLCVTDVTCIKDKKS